MAESMVTYRGTVYPWHCDHMGHMNVMWYVGKFDEATWHLLAALGLSRDKTVLFTHEMTNQETGELAARTVLTGVCVDASTRRARPLPADVRERAAELFSLRTGE